MLQEFKTICTGILDLIEVKSRTCLGKRSCWRRRLSTGYKRNVGAKLRPSQQETLKGFPLKLEGK